MPCFLDWSWAGAAMPGFSESGDRHVFRTFEGGALAAVTDGLGHGEQAALAAETTSAVLEQNASENVIALVTNCHEKLKGTRGVALSLASFDFDQGLMTWMGVGNVEGALLRADSMCGHRDEYLLLRAGVVGSHLPGLQAAVLPIFPGDMLILATDGIESGFDQSRVRMQTPAKAAQAILAHHARGKDDALVFVAKYKGTTA